MLTNCPIKVNNLKPYEKNSGSTWSCIILHQGSTYDFYQCRDPYEPDFGCWHWECPRAGSSRAGSSPAAALSPTSRSHGIWTLCTKSWKNMMIKIKNTWDNAHSLAAAFLIIAEAVVPLPKSKKQLPGCRRLSRVQTQKCLPKWTTLSGL